MLETQTFFKVKMVRIRIGADEIQFINLFEKLTGAKAQDMIEEENTICFLVSKEDMGLAIGKKGANIEKVRNTFNKNVCVIEYSEDMAEFVRNIFQPSKIREVRPSSSSKGRNIVLKIDRKQRGGIIGSKGEKIKLAKRLLNRHFNMEDIILENA
ncbi:MAG: NusA-like transcription termination signal-binding factor [Candidatus Altiarchaeales archaeon]|nr:NusA-like transcription termination signal-binding factor [Candidatus Altiarchaeales archaeon]